MGGESYKYQLGFAEMHRGAMYDSEVRSQKALKAVAVIYDYLGAAGRDPKDLTLLDIGCSTGFLTSIYGKQIGRVVGIDIDDDAIRFAKHTHQVDNVEFFVRDSMSSGFEDESFDVVTCTHVYEHVPDAERLVSEIHRVLRPGGICYFAAGNRLIFMEPHYRLPLLSVIPKPFAHFYVKLTGKSKYYYEKQLSFWGLKELVKNFEVIDYTEDIIRNPTKYYATDVLKVNSLRQRVLLAILKYALWLCPTYIWILRKPIRS